MTLFNLLILAVVQGITEFLPISSSAHLVLLHELGGPSAEALALDVAVHLGSILAVVLYFRQDVAQALKGIAPALRGRLESYEARLAFGLAVATLPALLLGALLSITGWIEHLRNVTIIGWMMIVFGVLLYIAHRYAPEVRRAEEWSVRDAVLMGLWQAVALVPGVSRSGITMTAGRILGFDRHSAAKIALLMSIPITLATGAHIAMQLRNAELDTTTLLANSLIGGAFAFIAAYVALATMMKLLRFVSFTPYVVYRVILGVVLLAIAYS
ncbi:undecaprenyl-diphosphate phosphatase [Pararhodobacter sp. SW119]|uniref:undecaprenyl-diphosphate phosphatase n=1 Tax=Pararhodobacter sp. SW119 TaxID=2780075 RepID=UPI001ADF0D53|nr:undecaprenyl-diphosphate phosphatase [Pararhodobacter sp. SW119]